MIQGTIDSSVGKLYCYYHGPMRAVLSDMSLRPVFASADTLATTGQRIVFLPNEWTEINYADIREKWESGHSQLNHLEATGYLDIYTSKEEADKMKELLKDFQLPENLRHGKYVKSFEDKDVIKKYLEQKKKAEQEFVMPEQQKYFDLDKGLGVKTAAQKQDTIQTASTDTSKFDKILEMVKAQAEQNAKQVEQMNKMMETMQQVMLALISKKND